jgi:UDP-N-acetylglucosamine 2-epimerase (non-hydrolysing)
VEAGLRTHDPFAPFPEEVNRRLTTQLAALHLVPTPAAKRNLIRENVPEEQIVLTGNTVVDAVRWVQQQSTSTRGPIVDALDHDPRRVIVVTAHRRESWGPALERLAKALVEIARREPDVIIVFPVHRNPIVRDVFAPALRDVENIWMTEPLDYTSFIALMQRAHLILTDSGGIQEEAATLGKPLLILRETTERPEALHHGVMDVIGTDPSFLCTAVTRLLQDSAAYRQMARPVDCYGDGHAARRTLAALRHFFGNGPAADEFAINCRTSGATSPSLLMTTYATHRRGLRGRQSR